MGLKEINPSNFDLQDYDITEKEESFSIPKEIQNMLPGAVVAYMETNGKFKFHLNVYPGKNNPIQMIFKDPDNIIYYGQVARDKEGHLLREGKGFLLQDNSLYCGYFSRDVFEGPGLYIYFHGCMSYYRGFWLGGSLVGNAVLLTENGYKYSGEWLESLQDGYGQEYWPDNSTYKGDFKKGYKWGHGEFIWPGRQRYVGQFKEGEIDGYGTFEWSTGNNYEGNWTKNLMDGKGKFTWTDGTVYEGDYVNGKKEGFGTISNASGSLWEGQWKNGLKNGKGVFSNGNGEMISGYWKHDEMVPFK